MSIGPPIRRNPRPTHVGRRPRPSPPRRAGELPSMTSSDEPASPPGNGESRLAAAKVGQSARTHSMTLADLRKRLGNIPLDRIRIHPAPGTATVEDVVDVERRENRSCELVDGTLVEKASGAREAHVAWLLGHRLG